MIRNLKMLGLAISAMLMLGAMASMASAAEFHSEVSHTILTGTQSGTTNDVFTTDAGTTTCNKATYVGTQSALTTTTANAAPTYEECTATFGTTATVHPNGCEYVFHTGATNTTDIVCPAGKVIEVTAAGCVVTVPAQTGLTGITFSNEGSGTTREVIVHVDITNKIKYEEHNKGFFPTCRANTVAKSNGSYTGTTTITGETTAGVHVGVWYA